MNDQLMDKEEGLLDGDTVITSISFGQKDRELCKWVQSIPKGLFSYIIRDAINAYITNFSGYVFPQFPPKEQGLKTSVTKSLSIGINNIEVYKFIVSIKKFNRANEIKKIILQYWQNGQEDKLFMKRAIQHPAPDKKQVKDTSSHQSTERHQTPSPKSQETTDSNSYEDSLFTIAADMNGKRQ